MTGQKDIPGASAGPSRENIAYIRQMLAELAQVARREKVDMLTYLLEMAFTEASDLLAARSEAGKVEGNQSARMAVKPSGKI
ncbi:MAG: hypothetical protein KDJ87_02260 [Rhizobiaceae bacterium]|nr:hypothetical protein [Rhizobiaceae bacterium]